MHGRIWILLALLPMVAMADPPDAARGELRMALKGQALVAHLSLPAPAVVGFDHAPATTKKWRSPMPWRGSERPAMCWSRSPRPAVK